MMTVNYFSPVAITLALLPRMLARGIGHHRQRVEPGRPAGHHHRGGLQRLQVRPGRVERVDGRRPASGPASRSGWSCPGPSTPRSGTSPTTTPPSMTGPLAPPEEVAVGIVEAIDSDPFEHYLPDMKAVVEMKTKDIDGFMAGHAGHGRQARDRRGRGHSGARIVKALVFGARPTRTSRARSPTDELEDEAGPPALRPPRDGRRPTRPPRLGGHPAHPVRRVRLRRQAGPRRLRTTATSTTRWPRSPRCPTCPATRWWPRWWPWARRPGASRSASGWCSIPG